MEAVAITQLAQVFVDARSRCDFPIPRGGARRGHPARTKTTRRKEAKKDDRRSMTMKTIVATTLLAVLVAVTGAVSASANP